MHRFISIDILRIIACFLVITFHCDYILKPNFEQTLPGLGAYLIYHISTLGLPTFFIITSLSLFNENDYMSNLVTYYKKRLLNPGIPFFCMSIFYYLWNHFSELKKEKDIINLILEIFISSLQTPQHYHLWFIYSWFGLMILLPFLKTLLTNLSYNGLIHFIVICLLTQFLIIYLIVLIYEFYFGSWVIYYIWGYFLLKSKTQERYSTTYLLGIISFAISVWIHFMGYNDTVLGNHLFDTSPIMIFQTGALFCFFINISEVIDKHISAKTTKIIKKMSQYSVWIYLWHPFFLTKFGNTFRIKSNYAIDILCVAPAVFLMSLIMSIICEWVQKIISRILNYMKEARNEDSI